MTELIKYNAARKALTEARSIDEVRDVRDKAAAMRLYAQMAKDEQMERDAIEIRRRAERRLGEMIAAQKASTGLAEGAKGIGPIAGYQKTRNSPPTLAEAGVDKNLANRARTAAKMTEQEFESEISKLRNGVGKAKRAGKTSADVKKARAIVRGKMEKGEAIKPTKLGREHGIARIHVRTAAAAEQAAEEARADPIIDRESLSLTAQQKLDAALRQHKAKLEATIEQRVRELADAEVERLVMDYYREKVDQYQQVINAYRGLMPRATYRLILSCLHPDSRKSASEAKLAEAMNAFRSREVTLCRKDDSERKLADWPRTRADLAARKAAVQAGRRAKRAANGMTRT